METIFYRNIRIFALAILMIIAAGLSAFLTIGRQEDPTITNLFASVITTFPGADPARVEALVTEKIEDELKTIPEIDEIVSTSRKDISSVRIELSQYISETQIEQAWSEIRDALSDAKLNFPPGAGEPIFDNDRTGAFTAISAITAQEGYELNFAIAQRYAEILQDRLRNLTGTKNVELFGDRTEEILVEIEPRKLASLGLQPGQVSQAIANADAKVRAGQLRGTQKDLLLEVAGEITSVDRIRSIPIISTPTGRIVSVSDVANVAKQLQEPALSLAYTNGKPAILIASRMEDDLQVHVWIERVKREIQAFEKSLPSDLNHNLLFNQNTYTTDRLLGVLQNMFIGAGLVVTVLIFTLGWRAAIVVATILPLATLMSLSGLQFLGISIHQMSVTGLIVALGLLVDAAIVMTDEIRKALEKGFSRLEAVKKAVRRLAIPLLASTVTTVLAFMPMALLPGPAGDFVGSIAIAVITMLISSLLLALTIAPALAGWVLPSPAHPPSEPQPNAAKSNTSTNNTGSALELPWLGRLFTRSLDIALKHPRLAILAALILPIIGFASFPTLKPQFFPGVDRNQFYLQLKLPDSSSISQTRDVAITAEQMIRRQDGVEDVHWVIGENAPPFYYNMIRDSDQESSFAEALVTTRSAQTTEDVLPKLQRALDASLPQARAIVRGLVQGPPVDAPVEIRIVGTELDVLRKLGDQIRAIMIKEPDIVQARTTMTGGSPKVIVNLNEEKVRLAGLELTQVARHLEQTLEGATGGSLIEGSEELPVRVRTGSADRSTIDVLRRTDIVPPNLTPEAINAAYPGIPVLALGALQLSPNVATIFRKNGERINTVQGFVHRSILPEATLQRVQDRIAQSDFTLPAGYRLEVGGDADSRAEVLKNLIAAAGLIVALTLATIVLTFNSFRLSIVTFIVAILSMGLSLLASAVFQYPFGIQAVIGVIGSIGVSINAAIIIMTALQKDPQAVAGDLHRTREIVSAQSRHIISTTITTFGGFLPLILEGGGFWPPFAMAIAGGVLLSTIISFYFTPPAFRLMIKASNP